MNPKRNDDLDMMLLAGIGACVTSLEAAQNFPDISAEDWQELGSIYDRLLSISSRASGQEARRVPEDL